MRDPGRARREAAVARFCHSLVAATFDLSMHAPKSRYPEDAIRTLLLDLRLAADEGVRMPLEIAFGRDCMQHEGAVLKGPSLQARRLLDLCAEREIDSISFDPRVEADELARFFALLLDPKSRQGLWRPHRDRVLMAMGIRHLKIGTREAHGSIDPSRSACRADADLVHYQNLADCLQESHLRARQDRDLPVDHAQGAVEQALLRLESEPSGLLALAAQDNVDRFTVGHSVRVALLALQVARAVGADRRQLVRVGTASLLHDIGKSKIPQEILFKPGRLDPEEWAWMAQHPRLGAQILLEQDEIDRSAVGAAFCHHMRPSGEGYYPLPALPMRPSGTSRLVRICDVFEALTSIRPYKRALTPCEAYAVMLRQPRDFDPEWLSVFVRTLGLFPLGSRVTLDDGSMGQVIRQTDDPRRPVVKLLLGPDGEDLVPDAPDEVAIGRDRRIAEVLAHDRSVPLPDEDPCDPQILTQPFGSHACIDPHPMGGDSPSA
ncbi:MAG: hypothetical protein Fur0037_17420 [Planctomycetota bacterium]